MDSTILPALAGFVLAGTITPGPNNMMLMASGANFGFRRSIPHLTGVSAGVVPIMLLVGVGLMAVFDVLPALETVLRIVSAIYLLWLAWKIANAMPPETADAEAKPITFVQAAGFQWVNPKVWATGLSAVTLFAPDRSLAAVTLIALAFAAIGLASNAVWAWMGTVLRRWLAVGRRMRVFNVTMAVLLAASLGPVLLR